MLVASFLLDYVMALFFIHKGFSSLRNLICVQNVTLFSVPNSNDCTLFAGTVNMSVSGILLATHKLPWLLNQCCIKSTM